MSMGPIDGAAAARAYSAQGAGMESDVSSGAVRNDELMHDAGLNTGLSTPVKVAIGVVVAVVLVLVLVALLGS